MSVASRSSVTARSGSGEAEIPFIPLEEEEDAFPDPLPPPPPRSRLKMEGSDAERDVALLLDEVLDWTATTEAAIAAVVAGTLDGLCSLLERSRSQKRWNFERGFGLEASAGKVALLLTGWAFVPTGGSGVLRLREEFSKINQ